jgi:hypothetical protein
MKGLSEQKYIVIQNCNYVYNYYFHYLFISVSCAFVGDSVDWQSYPVYSFWLYVYLL